MGIADERRGMRLCLDSGAGSGNRRSGGEQREQSELADRTPVGTEHSGTLEEFTSHVFEVAL